MTKHSNSIVQYFSDVWSGVITTLKGMRLTITYFFKPKVTMQYPEVRPVIPDGHRGIHVYDEKTCGLCKQCQIICPVNCINIEALGRGKDSLILKFQVDYAKCLFCDLCCEVCKPESIHLGPQYDIATAARGKCLIEFARPKTAQEIEEFKVQFEKKEAERKARAAEAAKKAKEAAAQKPAESAAPAAPGIREKKNERRSRIRRTSMAGSQFKLLANYHIGADIGGSGCFFAQHCAGSL